jgi:hypothetical protein
MRSLQTASVGLTFSASRPVETLPLAVRRLAIEKLLEHVLEVSH